MYDIFPSDEGYRFSAYAAFCFFFFFFFSLLISLVSDVIPDLKRTSILAIHRAKTSELLFCVTLNNAVSWSLSLLHGIYL